MVSQEGNPSEHHLYLYLHVRYMYICMYNIHVTVCCIILYMTHNEVLLYYTVDLYSRHLGTKLNCSD